MTVLSCCLLMDGMQQARGGSGPHLQQHSVFIVIMTLLPPPILGIIRRGPATLLGCINSLCRLLHALQPLNGALRLLVPIHKCERDAVQYR